MNGAIGSKMNNATMRDLKHSPRFQVAFVM